MIIISSILVVVLWNLAHILKDLRHISKKVREGGDVLSQDLHDWHIAARTEASQFKHVFKYFKTLFSHRRDHKK